MPTLTLFLADRAYDDRGQLVPRGIAGSLIKEEAAVRARVRQFLQQGTVTTFSGNTLSIRARSILVHSDTPARWRWRRWFVVRLKPAVRR
jgi:UPF0271 protein